MSALTKNIFAEIPGSPERLYEQSIESFFKVFNVAPGGMCLTENSLLVEVNPMFENMFGHSRAEAMGKSNLALGTLREEEVMKVGEIFRTTGKLFNEEVTCYHKNGKKVHCLVTTSTLLIGGKQLILTSFSDVTSLKKQSATIAEQHKDLFDSVTYAKRIQEAIFSSPQTFHTVLPDSFLLLKPKSIVTGDFYWLEKKGNKIYVAAADCTGHGVPGALMSIIGHNIISKSLSPKNLTRPCEILNDLSSEIFKTLQQNLNSHGVKDGMDISLISIDTENMVMEYAAARQPVYRIRNNELVKLMPDRFPIGIYTGQHLQEFNNQQISLQRGDTIYMFTDGYTDQFGGPEKKKFKALQFQKLLLSIQTFSMDEQKQILLKELSDWQEDCVQVDDIMIIGIKI
ncbi:hypothetical protein CNR22_05405 [Sphingobacteriaceae bacterium]|nr:hypothetical protein CNR22_05405 [Sphingobacteriaceae bacterium]